MTIDFSILGLLSWRPLSGYDIKKMFADYPGFYWSGNNNQIYTTLVKLHKQGLVSREIQHQEDHPSRKIYSITPKGLESLRSWVLTEPEPPQIRNSFLLQLAWADQLDPAELDSLLERYEDEVQGQFLICKEKKNRNNGAPSRTRREAFIWEMIQQNWVSFYQTELDWIRDFRKKLIQE